MAGDEVRENLAVLRSEMIQIRNDLQRLLKVVLDGNGHSMVSRLAIAQTKIEELEREIKRMESNTLQTKIAMIAGIWSFVTSLGIVAFELYLKMKN